MMNKAQGPSVFSFSHFTWLTLQVTIWKIVLFTCADRQPQTIDIINSNFEEGEKFKKLEKKEKFEFFGEETKVRLKICSRIVEYL